MSAQAYRFSIGGMWHSGAKKQVRKHVLFVCFLPSPIDSFLTCFSANQLKLQFSKKNLWKKGLTGSFQSLEN